MVDATNQKDKPTLLFWCVDCWEFHPMEEKYLPEFNGIYEDCCGHMIITDRSSEKHD